MRMFSTFSFYEIRTPIYLLKVIKLLLLFYGPGTMSGMNGLICILTGKELMRR